MMTPKKNPHAVALGRIGAKARMVKLSPAQRSEIALRAITARWDRVRAEVDAARVAAASKKAKRKSRKAGGATHV
jgi:hypothetical protein